MKNTIKIYFFILLMTFFSACKTESIDLSQNSDKNITKQVKYIFLFIGDGMSFSQMNIAKAVHHHPDFRLNKKPNFGNTEMNISKFPVAGIATTYASDRYITESAAAATSLATGKKTTCGTVSLSPDHTEVLKTIAEMSRDKGMKVGIVSSVNIDHATPACFFSHTNNRGKYNDIASQMAVSNSDYFGGGFAQGASSNYMKKENAKNIPEIMQSAGYNIVTNKEDLEKAVPGQKYWAYNEPNGNGAALLYEIDQPKDYIRLADFTEKGIELLDNPNGFFMMVESGKIDWACHANDAVTAAHEVVALDESIGKALEFYKKYPEETLIIVTGDHECGGLTLGYSAAHYESAFDVLNHQKISFEQFSKKVHNWKKSSDISQPMVLDSVKYYFGLGDTLIHKKMKLTNYENKRLIESFAYSFSKMEKQEEEEYYVNYGSYDPLTVTITHILNQKAGINWSSYSHTPVPVPIYALGTGSENFGGQLDNTDIPKQIMKLAKLN